MTASRRCGSALERTLSGAPSPGGNAELHALTYDYGLGLASSGVPHPHRAAAGAPLVGGTAGRDNEIARSSSAGLESTAERILDAKFDSGRPVSYQGATLAVAFVPSLGDSICRPSVDISRLAGQRWARRNRGFPFGSPTRYPRARRRRGEWAKMGRRLTDAILISVLRVNYVASWATLRWVAATAVVPSARDNLRSAPLS